MNLTNEQLTQCRAEFETKMSTWCLDLSKDNVGDYRSERTDDAWAVWKAAWRPRLMVEEVLKCLHAEWEKSKSAFDLTSVSVRQAQAIVRAQGGEE